MTVAEPAAHRPVLAEEVVDALGVAPRARAVDATFGRGGHTRRILDRLGPQGEVLALDRDPTAVAHAGEAFPGERRLFIRKAPFSRLRQALVDLGWEAVDAVLADLGASSPQLEDPARGFSFRQGGPLDMRMDPESGPTAREWLAGVSVRELEEVLRAYGEERYARRIARAITAARDEDRMADTADLAAVARNAVPGRGEPGKDKATRTFQALRMAVNREMEELEAFLGQAVAALKPGGRLVVIAFHSIEDRMVKRFIREEAATCVCPPGLPVCRCEKVARLRPVGRVLRPGEAERENNPRARSAIARVAERLPE